MKIFKIVFEEADKTRFSKKINLNPDSSFEMKPYGKFFSIEQAIGMMKGFGYSAVNVYNETGKDVSRKYIESDKCDSVIDYSPRSSHYPCNYSNERETYKGARLDNARADSARARSYKPRKEVEPWFE